MSGKTAAWVNDPRSEASKAQDLISRGDYSGSPVGRAVFFLVRSLDPFIQYSILAHGAGSAVLHRVGLHVLPSGPAAQTGIAAIDNLGLSPYRLILLGMAVGGVVKQNIWVTTIGVEPMPVRPAITIGFFNAFFDSLNSYLLITSTSAVLRNESDLTHAPIVLGSGLYLVGILTELISEVQRKRFKADPKNKGKPYTGGLWSFARHINYGGYTLWRAGAALAGGGWIWGAIVGTFIFHDFATRSVPILNEYCEVRYGEAWEKFKKQTQWRLIPLIY
ncbi:hypothetical protein GQ43DRAFT_437927 [Delitschia confertaspora ATCC 74209]|uniref:Steroid 5-alpha reductase C-terminal domain-containing protein n=1 Tax=Delitschia confertaspora ATCC 74209 TaxID=1513339 RepID=A0A9P4JSL4_9PLEO|nr:hypothetical protein GQ43DRAFT_437927 [Delitschia confertaspora ATCC 74209]